MNYLCQTCGYKVISQEEVSRCPNCQNVSLIKTAPPEIPKRVDQLKEVEVEEDI